MHPELKKLYIFILKYGSKVEICERMWASSYPPNSVMIDIWLDSGEWFLIWPE